MAASTTIFVLLGITAATVKIALIYALTRKTDTII